MVVNLWRGKENKDYIVIKYWFKILIIWIEFVLNCY